MPKRAFIIKDYACEVAGTLYDFYEPKNFSPDCLIGDIEFVSKPESDGIFSRPTPMNLIACKDLLGMSSWLVARAFGEKFEEDKLHYIYTQGLASNVFSEGVLLFNIFPEHPHMNVSGMALADGSGFTLRGVSAPAPAKGDFSFVNLVHYTDRRKLNEGLAGNGFENRQSFPPTVIRDFRMMALAHALPSSISGRNEFFMPFIKNDAWVRDAAGRLGETPILFEKYIRANDGSAFPAGASLEGRLDAPGVGLKGLLARVLEQQIEKLAEQNCIRDFVAAYQKYYPPRARPRYPAFENYKKNFSPATLARVVS